MHKKIVAALGAAGVIALSSGCGSSWPNAWCGPVEDTLHHGSSPDAIVTVLQQQQQRQGAPDGQLISDYGAAEAAVAAENTDANLPANAAALDDLVSAQHALQKIQADAQQVNLECGKPKNWETGTVHVPASG